MAIKYEKYWLSKIISAQAIVSADYRQKKLSGGAKHIHQDAWELIMCMAGSICIFNGSDNITLEQG